MAVTTDAGAPKQTSGLGAEVGRRFRSNIQTYTIILALVAIWVLFAVLTSGAFLSPQNMSNLFRQMTVTSFLAIGMVFVIVTGNIDLSVGKLAGFVSVVAAYLQANVWYQIMPDQPLIAAALSVLIGVGVGVLWGVLQGYIIAFLNVPAFIVTLGGMFVLNGLILLVTQGKTIPANQPIFSDIAQGYLPPLAGWVIAASGDRVPLLEHVPQPPEQGAPRLSRCPTLAWTCSRPSSSRCWSSAMSTMVNQYRGIQTPVLLLAITAMIMAYVSNNTRFGRYAYAIGGNREAARLSGINIKRSIFLIFILMGLLSGIAGIVLASYVGYGTIAAGQGYELDAIASAILGGTSTMGGSRHRVWGADRFADHGQPDHRSADAQRAPGLAVPGQGRSAGAGRLCGRVL